MQKTVRNIKKIKKENLFKLTSVILVVVLVFIIGGNKLSDHMAERNYQTFIKTQVFVDDKGVNILGTYVPVEEGFTHKIIKEESEFEFSDKDYVLYAVRTSDSLEQPIMRITSQNAKYLNRFLCKSTTIDLSQVKALGSNKAEDVEK